MNYDALVRSIVSLHQEALGRAALAVNRALVLRNWMIGATWLNSSLCLRASTRVAPAENYNLEERARRASREGLMLSEPHADYALPPAKVSLAVQSLREQLLADVVRHIAGYNRVTGRTWRLGDIAFGVQASNPGGVRTAKGAYRSTRVEEAFETTEDETFTDAERIVLNAEVTLKAEAVA